MAPLVLIDAVGLTAGLLPLAPRLSALASSGWAVRLREVLPAVTCAAQASLLTGVTPDRHGIVGNGWLYRDTGEVRFWQQAHHLLQAETLYEAARRAALARGRSFRCAKLFWWFNQGAPVDLSVTPKPHYGADGNKILDIQSTPPDLAIRLERALGKFPFPAFWGPLAGLPSSDWIARCGAWVLREGRPDLMLVYLPHLDYDLQRHGPARCDLARTVGELDAACAPLLDAARKAGARVWVVSECGHASVQRVALPNRALRHAGLLNVRPGPFGEQLDTFDSRAFAVCDHQVAHVYVRGPEDIGAVRACLEQLPGVAQILDGPAKAAMGLAHPRSGDLVALSEPDAWFAYPFWLEDRMAPDYARTVDIHRKPGYDPCELFFDTRLRWPRARVALRLLEKKLGFRTKFDVVSLDSALVGGSHGLPATAAEDRPLLIGDGPAPAAEEIPLTGVASLLLSALGNEAPRDPTT